jgi:hypothetical protein
MDGEANPVPSGAEAAKVNEILRTKYYDAGGVTWWWNSANTHLGEFIGEMPVASRGF